MDYLLASSYKGPRFKSPGGYLCETGILLLAMSRYISDPAVIDHFCGLIWGGRRPKPSLGSCADNLDLTQLFCSCFTLAVGLPSGFTTTESAAGGEPCWEPAISLHSHHVSLVQWTTCLLPVTRTQVQIPRGVLMWNRDSPVSDVSLQPKLFFFPRHICKVRITCYMYNTHVKNKGIRGIYGVDCVQGSGRPEHRT